MHDIDLNNAIEKLQIGESIIFPTDTVYGIGCDATNPDAIQAMLELTHRPTNKGLVILCDSLSMIEQYADIQFSLERHIIENVMPGALTLILNSKNELPTLIGRSDGTLGVRIPDDDITLKLITEFGKPIATKSANITGLIPATSVDEIDDYFIDHDVTIIDGGSTDIQMPSTIIRVVSEDSIQVLRQGSLSEEEIMELID